MQFSLVFVLFGFAVASPVEKVVQLLRDLEAELQGDETAEQLSYNKYHCWCETTSARKGKAIDDAQAKIGTLTTNILAQKATVAIKEREAKEAEKEIQVQTEALEGATALRQKESAAARDESATLMQAVAASEKALNILHTVFNRKPAEKKDGQFLQANAMEATQSVQALINAMPVWAFQGAPGKITTEKMNLLQQVAQGTYAPQSATVQGIIADMYSTFAQNLEELTQKEAVNWHNFEVYEAATQKTIADQTVTMNEANAAKAAADKALADHMEDYDDTESQMKADKQFFDEMDASCRTKSSEWDLRKSLRAEELKGVQKAIELLSSDDARKLFGEAIDGKNLAFFQVSSEDEGHTAQTKQAAYQALKAAATQSHSVRLAELAATVGMSRGHFAEVITSIDAMVKVLKEEDASDIKMRDQCKADYQAHGLKINDLTWQIETNEAKISQLEATIAKEMKLMENLANAMLANQKEQKDMGDQRDKDHGAYKDATSKDAQAITLLDNTIKELAAYFKGCTVSTALTEVSQEPEFARSADAAPEADFYHKDKNKHQTCDVVIGLLNRIKKNLQIEKDNADRDEKAAVISFDKAMAALKAKHDALFKSSADASKRKADADTDKTDENTAKIKNEGDKKGEQEAWDAKKPDCDWMFKSFEERARRRTAEMDGLTQAKAFLAGLEEGSALVQKPVRLLRGTN